MNLGWILNWRKIIWDIFVKNGRTLLHILDAIMELLLNFLGVITVLWFYSKMSISLGDACRNKKEWNIIMYITLKLFSKKRERKKKTVWLDLSEDCTDVLRPMSKFLNICTFSFFKFFNLILFIFLYSRFLVVINFIHISVYMSVSLSLKWYLPHSTCSYHVP